MWPRLVGCTLQTLVGEGRKRVQRLAELVERQRLHVKLDVGALARRIGAREEAELRRRHGERPAPAQRVVEPHAERAEPRMIDLVERLHAGDLVDQREAADDPAGSRRRPAGRARPECRAPASAPPGRRPTAAGSAASRSSRPPGSPRRGSARAASRRPAASARRSRAGRRTRRPRPGSRSRAAGWARSSTGLRKPRAADQRRPRFWLTWK